MEGLLQSWPGEGSQRDESLKGGMREGEQKQNKATRAGVVHQNHRCWWDEEHQLIIKGAGYSTQ